MIISIYSSELLLLEIFLIYLYIILLKIDSTDIDTVLGTRK